MNILIVAPFCSLPCEAYFNRFLYLAEFLSDGNNVTLVTSAFRHFDKTHREKFADRGLPFEVVLIDEPGYKRNISLSRVWSHWRFVRNFKKWMGEFFSERDIDVVYSAYPLLGTNVLLGKNKEKFGYKLIIDVQDVWPEAIAGAFPLIKKVPLSLIPFSKKANLAYSLADELVAVSESYLRRARLANPTSKGLVVYIGSDAQKIQSIAARNLGRDELHFVYIGTIGHSYDLATVVQAFSASRVNGRKRRLHILGDGPGLVDLKKLSSDSVSFYGFLGYEEMIAVAKGADYLINPIKSAAMQSVTNKLSDYILLDKPILSSQTNLEVLELLKEVPSMTYEAGNIDDLVEVMVSMCSKKYKPSPKYLLDLFDRKISYGRIKNLIQAI